MPGRQKNTDKARQTFQGQEQDREWLGGNAIAYKYRFHDPRLGRFLSVDPLMNKYAYNSTYAFSENRVIDRLELEGKQIILAPILLGFAAKLGRPIIKWGRQFLKGKPRIKPVKPKGGTHGGKILKPAPKPPVKPVPFLPPIGHEDYIDPGIIDDLKKHEPKRDNLQDFIDNDFENTYMYKYSQMEDSLEAIGGSLDDDDDDDDDELVYQMYGIDSEGNEVTIKYGTAKERRYAKRQTENRADYEGIYSIGNNSLNKLKKGLKKIDFRVLQKGIKGGRKASEKVEDKLVGTHWAGNKNDRPPENNTKKQRKLFPNKNLPK
jgi:RHS repeat-associated protein